VRIAVVDSGIHAGHPHVGGITGGAAIADDGPTGNDLVDRLGHGTAVAAAIREKAPDAELVAVKVFDRSLATTGATLTSAIRWATAQHVALINLSLGTTNQEHRPLLGAAVADASANGAIIVAAAADAGANWLPGALAGVVAVTLDWKCPRDACRVDVRDDGAIEIAASGFPRPIPGVAPADNLKGLSFAVANATGLIACTIEGRRVRSIRDLAETIGALAVAARPD
jgi:subtilisin family serine protease